MSYFPAFLDLSHKKILIIGGGFIAYEKLRHMLDFSLNISIVALHISKDVQKLINTHNLTHDEKAYEVGDIKGFDMVIVATDDISLQKSIYYESKNLNNCLVNSVDGVSYCDFIFPSYIKKGDLTIAVSTSGSSPAFAKLFKIYISKLIPNDIGKFLEKMKNFRNSMPKGENRMKFLDKKAKEYIDEI